MSDEMTKTDANSDSGLIAAARQQAAGQTVTAVGSRADQSIDSLSIPGYEFVREISRGGQGAVFEALQLATKRRVAIKVMLHGAFAGARERQRFEREVEILAQLRHPNIVTIHDSGIADGRFYYVMDFIPGRPLDQYAKSRELRQRDRLALFQKICEAVNAAHRSGVIHRDLKPGNILVNDDGEPLILDFGLAKTSPEIEAESPQLSMTGQFLGSLPWASPEQVHGAPGKIDLRTDVYALGVVLYQLLTDRFPYQVMGAMRDVLENILNAVPARPSSVRRAINHEVETIVLKCLNKDADRRYESAGQLARDVQRYLNGEAIEAKRDSMLYVVRKHAARHKFQSIVLGLLGIVIFGTGYVVVDLARGLWAASQDVESASNAARTNTVLLDMATEYETIPVFEQLALCAFVSAQQSGRPERAREILQQFPLKQPCRQVMGYLLDSDRSDADLMTRLPTNRHGMGQFAIAIRRMRAGDVAGAKASFAKCLAGDTDKILKEEAESYLAQLQDSNADADE